MDEKTYYVENAVDGTRLSVLRMTPENPRFAVQLIHGIAEHKGRYRQIMQVIASFGGVAIMHDLRGHGRSVSSSDDIGYYGDAYNSICGDIDLVYDTVWHSVENEAAIHAGMDIPERKELPRFLLGFSMGALIASVYLAHTKRKLSGVILAGLPHAEPFVGLGLFGAELLALTAGERYQSKLLNAIGYRMYNRTFSPEPESDGQFLWLSNDLGNREAFEADPLCGCPNTVNAFENLFRLVRDVYRPSTWDMNQPEVPLLMLSGELDPVAGGDNHVLKSEKFFRDIGFTNVKNTVYRGMRHEIFNDTGREYPVRDVLNFIRSVKKSETQETAAE